MLSILKKGYLIVALLFIGCKKIIEIPPPVSTITFSQVFSGEDEAFSAMAAIYSGMINGLSVDKFSNGALTIFTGASSDELNFFFQTVELWVQFSNNNLNALNNLVASYYWNSAYSFIYQANSIIQGLSISTGIGSEVKNELVGQAKFIRAFCYFYLLNLFGDIPIVTTINYRETSLLFRASKSEVYKQVVSDLKDAQNILPDNYSSGNNERIIPNKWVATALLARVNLYLKNWEEAEHQSSLLINNYSMFNLVGDLDSTFLIYSPEAIWQLKQNNSFNSFNATPEGKQIIPFSPNSPPFVFLTEDFLNSTENDDNRIVKWVDSVIYPPGALGIKYYYPKKYKDGPNSIVNSAYNEYYMVFRLAEQYLIRAEGRAMQENLAGAIEDINKIRNRAGLDSLPNTLNQQQILDALMQERRVELFAEWGHRWLDLKRWNKVNEVIGSIKGSNWQNTDQLYPIPQSEVSSGANIIQNEGY